LDSKTTYKQMTDSQLIAKYKQSSVNDVIGEFYQRYAHLVFGVCLKILKNKQECEDMVMVIFQQLGEKLLKHDIQYFKSWLYQLTRNDCLMLLRKGKNVKHEDFVEGLHESIDNNDVPMQKLDCFELNLQKAMSELKTEQRIALELFYEKEWSYVEISKDTGWDLNKVKSYIQNARRNLKLILQNLCHGSEFDS